MKRSLFIAAAASAIPISGPLLASAADLTKRVRVETNMDAAGRHDPTWYCGSAVVWLNTASGIYYYRGDRWYGQTKRGAYTCEREAINAGNRANLEGR
jgi:hypothetical protein